MPGFDLRVCVDKHGPSSTYSPLLLDLTGIDWLQASAHEYILLPMQNVLQFLKTIIKDFEQV